MKRTVPLAGALIAALLTLNAPVAAHAEAPVAQGDAAQVAERAPSGPTKKQVEKQTGIALDGAVRRIERFVERTGEPPIWKVGKRLAKRSNTNPRVAFNYGQHRGEYCVYAYHQRYIGAENYYYDSVTMRKRFTRASSMRPSPCSTIFQAGARRFRLESDVPHFVDGIVAYRDETGTLPANIDQDWQDAYLEERRQLTRVAQYTVDGESYSFCLFNKNGGWATYDDATGAVRSHGYGKACRF